jgi:hypothetical protein
MRIGAQRQRRGRRARARRAARAQPEILERGGDVLGVGVGQIEHVRLAGGAVGKRRIDARRQRDHAAEAGLVAHHRHQPRGVDRHQRAHAVAERRRFAV